MKTAPFLLTVLLFLSSGILLAQEGGNMMIRRGGASPVEIRAIAQSADPGMINAEVNVMYQAAPTSCLAVFSLIQVGASAEETRKLANDKITSMKASLKSLGIAEKDVYMDFISFVPVYAQEVEKKLFSKSYTEVPKGFEFQANIQVHYGETEQLGSIIEAATQVELYDLLRVDYFVSNQDSIRGVMRTEALKLINEKLTDLETFGIFPDSQMRSMTSAWQVTYPSDRYRVVAIGSNKYEGLKRSVNAPLTGQTMQGIYESLPNRGFDLVINPVVTRPVVQFTCQWKYSARINPAPQPEKEYIWLTPQGEVKSVLRN